MSQTELEALAADLVHKTANALAAKDTLDEELARVDQSLTCLCDAIENEDNDYERFVGFIRVSGTEYAIWRLKSRCSNEDNHA